MTPLLSFMEPARLWWLLLIPVLVGLYLFLVNRKRKRNARIARTMFVTQCRREPRWVSKEPEERRHLTSPTTERQALQVR